MKFIAYKTMLLICVLGLMQIGSPSAHAHFIWLKSNGDAGNALAVVSFGETAAVEDYHLPESIRNCAVNWRGKTGNSQVMEMKLVDTDERTVLESHLPGDDAYVLEAICTYGIYHSSLLEYHAKHIHCASPNDLGNYGLSKNLKLELVPRIENDQLEITVYWNKKPLADAKLTLIDSEEQEQEVTSDKDGRALFSMPNKGLVSAMSSYVEDETSGEFDGAGYQGVAHYATLTFQSDGSTGKADARPTSVNSKTDVEFPRLPQAIASFGAAVCDGWLYVYSGHIGGAHEHSRENFSNHFSRIHIKEGKQWEELPMQQPLQGFPLVAYNQDLYRVGGMFAKNEMGEADELYSVSDFSRFDIEQKKWEAMPPLPKPRSSHDAVVIGHQLYVAGGWTLDGGGEGSWQTKSLVYDLNDQNGQWKELPDQPFERRALATSHWQGKLVVLGGIGSDGEVTRRVDFYDPSTEKWSSGPEVPGNRMGGFGISAWNSSGGLYVCGLDGVVYQLSKGGSGWQRIDKLSTPRFFHRLLPAGKNRLLAVGGASFESGHLDDVEFIDLNEQESNHETTINPKDNDNGATTNIAPGEVWPAFRGLGTSLTDASDLPITWDDETAIAWLVDLPGYGQSSPVVWHDRLFVTTMQGNNKETPTILCFDLASGEELWRRELVSTQEVAVSNYVTRSSPTPVVDAHAVFAFFESGEIISLNHDGEIRWQRSLVDEYGEFLGNHGIGSSLAATEDAIFVLVNHAGPSYLLAIDKTSGKNRWKAEYESRVAWSSPIVFKHGNDTSVIVSAAGKVDAYNTGNGNLLWTIDGLAGNNVPSATPHRDTIYIGSNEKHSNLAIQYGDQAEMQPMDIRWRADKPTSSFSSPLYYRGLVYFVNRAGVAFCVDGNSGDTIWNHRLGDSCWASPIGAHDYIYFFSKSGKTTIVDAGPALEIISENLLTVPNNSRVYGVAAVNSKLVVRMGTRLVCLGR